MPRNRAPRRRVVDERRIGTRILGVRICGVVCELECGHTVPGPSGLTGRRACRQCAQETTHGA